jgi:hypothetical protein
MPLSEPSAPARGSRFARALSLAVGLAGTTAGVLIRYAPGLVQAQDGTLRFGTTATMPLWLAWVAAVLLLAVLAAINPDGRKALRSLTRSRQGRLVYAVCLLLLLFTLLPVGYSRSAVKDQSIIAYLVFSTVGSFGLLAGLGSLLDAPARWLQRAHERMQSLRPGTFVVAVPLLVLVVSCLISWLVYGHVPRIHDNVAQVFQARLFSQGKLFAASPQLPQFFDLMLTVNDGRWYSQYPPGHPLLLTLGVLVGLPWLVNPLLGALTVLVIYYLGRELYDERTARLGTLLAALSPFLMLMSSQFMNHASSLFFTCLFMLGYARAVKPNGRLRHALLAGLALGMVLLVRPYTALLVAVPFALDAVIRVFRSRHLGRFVLIALGVGFMAGVLMLYNKLTGGNPFELGYVTRYGPGHGLGFGRSGWGQQTYALAKAFAATALDLNAVNRYLFEFPIPGLLFIALLFAARQARRNDYLLLGVFASLVVGHFFYWWHDLLFGPRWEYEAIPALVLLSARGLRAIPDFRRDGLHLDPQPSRNRLARLLVLCCLSLLAVGLPSLIRRVPGTFGIRTETASSTRRVTKPALVITPRLGDVFLENRLPPGGDVVYANDLGELNPLLTTAYPGRRCYYANLDTLRELPDLDFPNSRLKQELDSTVAELARRDTQLFQFRSLFWPTDELIPMVNSLALRHGLKVVSYRTLDRISVGERNLQGISFPALAAWVLGDKSEHVTVFGFMNQRQSFSAGGLQFRFIGTSPGGLIALYAIYPAR